MQTRVFDSPADAAATLRQGGLVALPTETVYGLAARCDLRTAVEGIFSAKQRPADNPLICHIADASQLPAVAREIPDLAHELLTRFSPGPLTVTLPRRFDLPTAVTAGLDTVAVRIPDSPLFQQVLEQLGVPLVAPSANRSGRPSPTTWQAAFSEMNGRADGVLMGPPARVGIESTVVDCVASPPRLLRPGAVTLEQLREVIPELQEYHAPEQGIANQTIDALPSPGMRHRHYAPQARVHLFDDPAEVDPKSNAMYVGLEPHPDAPEFAAHYAWRTVEEYARELFALFYEADTADIDTIHCQRVKPIGLGRGLMDRLRRAAQR